MSQLNNRRGEGFTLIELMIAMSFIALLLLAIAMTTIQISNIYTKGITFRSVNQVGRDLSDSLTRDISASAPFNISNPADVTDTSRRYAKQFAGGDEFGGRLCTGAVSYVWNYGKYLGNAGTNVYADPDGSTPIRLVRVLDSGGQLCTDPSLNVTKSAATELLSGDDTLDLVLHNFSITSSVAATDVASGQQIYAISFTLGTNEQQALMTNNTQCVPPAAPGTPGSSPDWEYCAVNVFDIVVRAGNQR